MILKVISTKCRKLKSRESIKMHLSHNDLDMDFPGNSPGKESTFNAQDLIQFLKRSPGEGIGYPLQYSWASLVAQMVKNLPAMQETWVGKIPWRRASEGLFGQSFSIALLVQALRGLPCLRSFSVVRHIRHIEGPPWLESYFVIWHIRHLKGHPGWGPTL